MTYYYYTGRDEKGKFTTGRIEADSELDVVYMLGQKGIAVISVKELSSILYKEIDVLSPKVKSQEFVIYIRQFSTLLKAGISVVDSTSILAEQTNSKPLKKALLDVVEGLEEGNPFSDVASEHPRIFPALFINMMKAGEAGGNLDEILDRLAIYYEKQHETRQKVKSALAYPVVLGVIAIAIVIFLLSTIVPTFASMLQSFGGELPWITKFVLESAEWFTSYWWMVVLCFLLFPLFFIILKRNDRLKYYYDYGMLKLPIFGKLLQKAALARMTRTLSSLFSSSVPIIQSVGIVQKIVGNKVIEKVLDESRHFLERGDSMVIPMERHWIFPPLVTQMIAVGEKTGALDTMLDKVADFYETEVETATEQIKSMIEPLMIVMLSVIVGGIVASIAIPMFSIFENVGL